MNTAQNRQLLRLIKVCEKILDRWYAGKELTQSLAFELEMRVDAIKFWDFIHSWPIKHTKKDR